MNIWVYVDISLMERKEGGIVKRWLLILMVLAGLGCAGIAVAQDDDSNAPTNTADTSTTESGGDSATTTADADTTGGETTPPAAGE
jgi:hypothetical protein